MILPDNPIESQKDDTLKRYPLAKKMAELVLKFEGKQSYVIGVEGAWGSGKTSFINLMIQDLKDKPVLVLQFNPWIFSDQDNLVKDFFNSLISLVEDNLENASEVDKIRKYVDTLIGNTNIVISPEISLLGVIKVGAGQIYKAGTEKTLREKRSEIDSLLRRLDKKILIVIDDIDRLDEKETKLIFKLVKLMADFPNTVFVLAYDREKVEIKLASSDHGISGTEYLKKIIQVSFGLPNPDRKGLQDILFHDLDKTIELMYGVAELDEEDKKRWDKIFYSGFSKLFPTIRDIKRYISSLRLDWSVVGISDVNKIDFMAISAIRTFAPQFYNLMVANKSVFTGTWNLSEGFSLTNNQKERQERYNELLDNVSEKNLHKNIDGICKELFPQLNFQSIYGSEWSTDWRKKLRICSDEKFDFYFQLGVPEGEISEYEMSALLGALTDQDNFNAGILKFKKDQKLRKILDKLTDHLDKLDDEKKIKILLLSIWGIDDDTDNDKEGVLDLMDVDSLIRKLGFRIIKNINKNARKDFILDLLNTSDHLYYPLALLSSTIEEADEANKTGNSGLIEQSDISVLKSNILKRIESFEKDGKLDHENHLASILFKWKILGSEEMVQNYIEKRIKNKENLLILLRNFIGKVYSSAGDYNYFDKKSLNNLYPMDKIDVEVSKITEEEIAQLDSKFKEVINLFKSPAKDWGE